MNTYPIPAFNDNYIWLLMAENKTSALCVDPGDAQPVIDFVHEKQLNLEAILLIHAYMQQNGLQSFDDLSIFKQLREDKNNFI